MYVLYEVVSCMHPILEGVVTVVCSQERQSADECLTHPWLTDNRVYQEVLYSLQTSWMKGILARRRWHRWYHAITAMNRMKMMSADTR